MDDLIARLLAFEGSDELGNGDFSLMQEATDALGAAREDAARLDWLEGEASLGIRLHNGDFSSNKHVGLGLANTGRTLRKAIDDARGEARNG